MEILMILTDLVRVSRQSIAGLTYHDEIDENYRNVDECNPFYWHPLHLPEQCAEMYADLIRSRVAVAAKSPVRVVTKRGRPEFVRPRKRLKEDVFSLRHYYKYFEPEYEQPIYETEYIYGNYEDDRSIERYKKEHRKRHKQDREEEIDDDYLVSPYFSPYDKMLALLKQDIDKNPITPVITMSNYGPVAMYRQPISKRSRKIINKISQAYARENKAEKINDGGYYYGKIEYPLDNSTNNDRPNKNVDPNVENLKIKKLKLKGSRKTKKHSKSLIIE